LLLLVLSVVLLVVDFVAEPVLLAIDLPPLRATQPILTILTDLTIQPGLLPLNSSGFMRSQRAAFDALRDTILLILPASIDLSREARLNRYAQQSTRYQFQ
jgi:hypothetical protein